MREIQSVLRPFQIEGLKQLNRFRGRALLADEQGLGKTIQALAFLVEHPSLRPAIVVTPASMKWTWRAEGLLHFGLRLDVLEGSPEPGQVLPGPGVILNYEILRNWLPLLLAAHPKCVIFDEVHYIKNTGARRTKAALQLAKRSPCVIGLSGTPLTNRPIELWPALKAIRPDLFPSKHEFAWRYCRPRLTPWGWQFDGAEHLDELHDILRRGCMIRRLKKDVLQDLPAKIRKAITFRLSDPEMEEYRRAETDFIGWLRTISPARALRAARAEAITRVGYLLRLAATLKLPWTERWVREFLESHPGEKLVLLTMYRSVVDHLAGAFPGAVIIDGRTTGRMRYEAVRKFQTHQRSRLLLGNWRTAGVGITLHAACHGVVADFPWTPGDLVQGEDRLHRIGQERAVTIFYLATLETIEERLIRLLRRKTKILDAVLDGGRCAKDLSIFDELLTEIAGGHLS